MSDVLLSSRDDAVLTLTINRPEALNALNRETTQALRTAIDAAGRDAEVGAIILTGAGRAFCAGADLKDVSARYEAGDSDLGADLRTNYTPMIRAIRACPKPVIAALNGTAAGAGLSLALACDLRLAATGTQLIVVFVRVGLVPDAGSLFFLTRMLGLSKATELAITGDPLSAEDAHRLGLVAAFTYDIGDLADFTTKDILQACANRSDKAQRMDTVADDEFSGGEALEVQAIHLVA